MLTELGCLVNKVEERNSKLILLVGPPMCGKTNLLVRLAESRNAKVLNMGVDLGARLAALPRRQRALQVNVVMRYLVNNCMSQDLLLLDNIELLFDRSLKIDPMGLLKRHARTRRVVAVWPGQLRERRLIYAEIGHPEHRDYDLDGLVPFEIDAAR